MHSGGLEEPLTPPGPEIIRVPRKIPKLFMVGAAPVPGVDPPIACSLSRANVGSRVSKVVLTASIAFTQGGQILFCPLPKSEASDSGTRIYDPL